MSGSEATEMHSGLAAAHPACLRGARSASARILGDRNVVWDRQAAHQLGAATIAGQSNGLADGVDIHGHHFTSYEERIGVFMGVGQRKLILPGQYRDGLIDDLSADDRPGFEQLDGGGGFCAVVRLRVNDDVGVSEGSHDRTTRRARISPL